MLTDAWKLYASYDYNAQLQQKNFRRYQGTLLLLGLAATLLATLLAGRQMGQNERLLEAGVRAE